MRRGTSSGPDTRAVASRRRVLARAGALGGAALVPSSLKSSHPAQSRPRHRRPDLCGVGRPVRAGDQCCTVGEVCQGDPFDPSVMASNVG